MSIKELIRYMKLTLFNLLGGWHDLKKDKITSVSFHFLSSCTTCMYRPVKQHCHAHSH